MVRIVQDYVMCTCLDDLCETFHHDEGADYHQVFAAIQTRVLAAKVQLSPANSSVPSLQCLPVQSAFKLDVQADTTLPMNAKPRGTKVHVLQDH